MFKMLLKDLRISPLRSFLTGFSMFIGIVAVIGAVLVGTVGRGYLEGTNEQLYGRSPNFVAHAIETEINAQNVYQLRQSFYHSDEKIAIQVEPLEQLWFVPQTRVLPANEASSLTKAIRLDANYVTPEYNLIYNLPLVEGRWFITDLEYANLEAVYNKPAADLYPQSTTVSVSNPQTVTQTPLNVVGVVNDGISEPRIYVNIAALYEFAPDVLQTQGAIFYWLNDKNHSKETIRGYLNDKLVDFGGGKVDEVMSQDASSSYRTVLEVLQLAFGVVALLLLSLAAIGLLNIGLASLEQRTQELLIRRALGATRASIAGLVLGGALLSALIASALAVAVSYLLTGAIALLLPVDSPVTAPAYPYSAVIIAVIAATVTALVGGIFPMIKAIRLQPALALR